MAPLVRQIESLRRAGVEIDVLEVKGPRRWKYPLTLRELHRRAGTADLIHAHYAYCGWLARMQTRIPVICSFMGDDVLGTPDSQGRIGRLSKQVVRASRVLARLVDAAIVKSAQMAHILAPAATHVIPNGVDVDAFRPMPMAQAQQILNWSAGRRYVLFAGNPANPRKGFDLAQQAVKAAQSQWHEPLELIALWGAPPERVPLSMNACDALLMTSWLEGSPNVVKEALACNLPIASVEVGDTPELLAGVEGCQVCPRRPEALGEAIVSLLKGGGRSEGRAALLEKGLDLESVADRIIELYRHVLSPETVRAPRQGRRECQLAGGPAKPA
jgi:glycosyltransferase involved in cell wall biosynthesis